MDEIPKPSSEGSEKPEAPSHTSFTLESDVIPPSGESGEGRPCPSPSERQWAVAIHLSALIGLVIPLFNIVAPLILWLLKRPESTWIDGEGKRVLNFQISFTIYTLIAALCIFILVGFLLLPILGVVYLAFLVVGAIRASDGISYHFPLTIRFLK